MDKKHMALIAIGVAVVLGWFFRFDVTPIHGGESYGGAFVLNRWTGDSYFTSRLFKGDVAEKTKVAP